MELSFRRLRAFFELLDKLGVDFWCFHDRDIAPEMATLAQSNAALDQARAGGAGPAGCGGGVGWGVGGGVHAPRAAAGSFRGNQSKTELPRSWGS